MRIKRRKVIVQFLIIMLLCTVLQFGFISEVQAATIYTISSSSLTVSMQDTGRYWLRLQPGDIGVFFGDGSTSNTYVKIDNTVVSFKNMTLKSFTKNGDVIEQTRTYDGVDVTLRLSIVNNGGYMKAELIFKNNNSSSRNIGGEFYWDTMVNGNDSSPFEFIENGWRNYHNGKQVTCFYKGTYHVVDASMVYAGQWNGSDPGWNYGRGYTYYVGQRVSANDTAAAIWWDPVPVSPGQTRIVSTILGVGELNIPPTLTLTSPAPNTRYFNGESFHLTGVVNDQDVGDIIELKYAIDNNGETTLMTFISNGSPQPFDFNLTIPDDLGPGNHELQVWALDNKGGASTVARVPFVREDFNIPGAPTYSNVTTNSFTVNWDTNGNVPGTIYELFDVNENTTVYRGTGTSYDKSGLQPNTAYSFKTRAENKIGRQSNYSAVTTIYTLANKPLSKGYDNITDNSVRLLWNPNGNPPHTNYHYEVRKKSDNSLVTQGIVNGTNVTIAGLSGGHEQYRFFVRAVNGDGVYTDFTELIIPNLVVYQKSNYAKAEWAIEMEDSDVLNKTGFEEGDEIPNFSWSTWGTGGQSLTTEEAYEGNRSVRIEDTITNGNHINFPATYSEYSIMTFQKKYFPNGTDLSISFYAKSTGSGIITPKGNGGWANTILYHNVRVAETAPVGSKTIKLDSLQGIRLGDHITTDTEPYPEVMNMYQIREIDEENKVITLNTGLKVQYNAGEALRYRPWRGAYTFPSRTVDSNQWTLFNVNTKVNNYSDYDVLTRGAMFYINTRTPDIVYLDNIRFGYATRAELYRDGVKVYDGFLSDYDDYEATDKTAPNPISSINVTNTGNIINITFDAPEDNGTTYNYQLKAVKHNGDIISSAVKSITITSGIKGYSYVIDSNPNTVPDNIVDTTTTEIQVTINPHVKNYIHIKVIDNEGNASEVFHQEIGIPVLTATPVHEEDYIHLDWFMADASKDYAYMIYKKMEGEDEFQTIPAKDRVKVLNVYPEVDEKITYTTWDGTTRTIDKSASVEMWMEAPNSEHPKGYGMGLIDVDPISINEFNENPYQYLKDDNGEWKYDVVFFGSWDSYGKQDINQVGIEAIKNFIESGRGLLLGHDTLLYSKNFTQLKEYLNIQVDTSLPNVGGNQVFIVRKGFLTNYPWKIGDVGTILNIPSTHQNKHLAYGDVWLGFYNYQTAEHPTWRGPIVTDSNGKGTNNFYLTTWNNTAMIQTGHSNGAATPDEQKILANTLFYLAQITNETSWDDHTGQDVHGPTKPIITEVKFANNGNTINIKYTPSEDIGTKYYYYVEGTATNTLVQSNIAEATIKSGLKGYSIVVDQNPDTVPDNIIETTSLEYEINQRFYQKFYVHVVAVDNVGNISEVAHYECTDTTDPTLVVTGNPTEWTKEDVVLTAKATDNESGIRGIKLPNGEWVYSDTATFVVATNGSYTFIAEDNFGNQTSVTVIVDKIDKTPPFNTTIIINNGALYTNNRDVVLTINAEDNATGVVAMRFRTENSPWSEWVPYATTFNYTMDAGFTHQGTNRVYVQFKDGVGNIGGDAFDSIVFDSIAPTGEIIFPKVTANTRNITLMINAYDINPASADAISGLNSVRFRELQDGVVKQDWTSWEQFNFTRNWILSDGDGVKVIEMEVKDNAGNIGKVTKSIVLDTLFIKEALFTDIVNPPLGNPELPTSEVVKVKKGYEFTFIVRTTGDPDYAQYTFNGETGYMIKLADNLFTKTLKVDINDDSVNNELLPINITVARNDGTKKTTTLKVHVEGSAYDDFNINLTN